MSLYTDTLDKEMKDITEKEKLALFISDGIMRIQEQCTYEELEIIHKELAKIWVKYNKLDDSIKEVKHEAD